MGIIRIIQREKVNKDGTAPLYVIFNINREKIRIPCKINVSPSEWDTINERIIGRGKEVKDKNLILSDLMARVSDIFVRYRLRHISLNKDSFFREYNNPSDYQDFHKFVKAHQKKLSKELELGTYKHHRSVMKKLEEYCPGLQFQEITPDFLYKYLLYLKRKLGNIDSTAYRNMSTIKIYVLEAIRKGYIEKINNPFDEFRIKRPKNKAVFLDEEELKQFVTLYNKGVLPERLQIVLRFFLFLCFTSLHISDAKALKIEQVSNELLTYYRIKNKNSKPEIINIPMSEPAMKLYNEIRKSREKELLFEKLPADQNINIALKEISDILEIKKNVSSKTGRHTFATIFLRRTKDVATLQKILGHSKIDMTMVYAHVLQDSKVEGVQVFNSFSL